VQRHRRVGEHRDRVFDGGDLEARLEEPQAIARALLPRGALAARAVVGFASAWFVCTSGASPASSTTDIADASSVTTPSGEAMVYACPDA